MKISDALRAEAKCRDMVDGTNLDWWEVIKCDGQLWAIPSAPSFNMDVDKYEFALGIVEGSPIFENDSVWFVNADGSYYQQIATPSHDFTLRGWTKTKPKPKPRTMMVEMLAEDVYNWVRLGSPFNTQLINNVVDACSKSVAHAASTEQFESMCK